MHPVLLIAFIGSIRQGLIGGCLNSLWHFWTLTNLYRKIALPLNLGEPVRKYLPSYQFPPNDSNKVKIPKSKNEQEAKQPIKIIIIKWIYKKKKTYNKKRMKKMNSKKLNN